MLPGWFLLVIITHLSSKVFHPFWEFWPWSCFQECKNCKITPPQIVVGHRPEFMPPLLCRVGSLLPWPLPCRIFQTCPGYYTLLHYTTLHFMYLYFAVLVAMATSKPYLLHSVTNSNLSHSMYLDFSKQQHSGIAVQSSTTYIIKLPISTHRKRQKRRTTLKLDCAGCDHFHTWW